MVVIDTASCSLVLGKLNFSLTIAHLFLVIVFKSIFKPFEELFFDEILCKQLKDEITNLKKLRIKDQLEIQEIKQKYQKEIDSLKEKFKSLLIQINELKKNKKGNNIIIDDSDINMEDNQDYSVECLTNKKDTEMLQGAEKTYIDIVIKNNSNKQYPKNTYLIPDTENSL